MYLTQIIEEFITQHHPLTAIRTRNRLTTYYGESYQWYGLIITVLPDIIIVVDVMADTKTSIYTNDPLMLDKLTILICECEPFNHNLFPQLKSEIKQRYYNTFWKSNTNNPNNEHAPAAAIKRTRPDIDKTHLLQSIPLVGDINLRALRNIFLQETRVPGEK